MSSRTRSWVVLLVLGAGLAGLVAWFALSGRNTTAGSTVGASIEEPTQDEPIVPTSETLIAAALAAGDISYEDSLLQRAYALHDDSRLQPAFRSAIADWEAGMALFGEIDSKEATLSKDLLAALEPFRVRPNDPRSIYSQPRAEVVKAQFLPAQGFLPADGWSGVAVPGTGAHVWIRGTPQQLGRYVSMTQRVWAAFPQFFPHPNRDDGAPPSQINPDRAIDIYLVDGTAIDPRSFDCYNQSLAGTVADSCRLLNYGRAEPAGPSTGRVSSGYVLVNVAYPDDVVMGTIAHELAHVTQFKYDNQERLDPNSKWVSEGTATWVEHRVLKALGTTPTAPYERVVSSDSGLFYFLHHSLDRCCHYYGTWLFFFHASIELGEDVVTRVWEKAANVNASTAVNLVIPFNEYFPRFAVRTLNDADSLPNAMLYRTHDGTFPRFVEPHPQSINKTPPPIVELQASEEPLAHLASAYFRFTFEQHIRRVTFQNLYQDLPDAHVWAIQKIGGQWKDPQDWSRETQKIFCRDFATEDLGELVLIVSNSHEREAFPADHPRPRVLSEDVGCPFIEGTAQSTLRLNDGGQRVTYTSSRVPLRFRPRTVQDQPGNVQYDLMPTSVIWTVSGTRGDCTLDGSATVAIPAFLDQPIDPSRTAYGYMNVVGLDGGDFHSINVAASDSNARIRKTCPGNPPRVTMEPLEAAWLVQVLSEKNTHSGADVTFTGSQSLDPARFQDSLPQVARDFLEGNPTLGPTAGRGRNGRPAAAPTTTPFFNLPGVDPATTAEIERAMRDARGALRQAQANMPGGRLVYTFDWNLKPAGPPPP